MRRKNKRRTIRNRTLAVRATQARTETGSVGTLVYRARACVDLIEVWITPRAAKSGYATRDEENAKALQHPAVADMLRRARGEMSGIKIAMVAALLGMLPVRIQEPAAAPGYAVKVEFENEQIRVLRVHYLPRATSPMHSHTGRAIIALTGSHLRVTTSDGTTQETERRPGELYWGDTVTHSAENLTDAPVETIEVEIKKANAPGVLVKTAGVDPPSLKEPVPVEKEPHHHVAFQNQYVRVLDVLFPVGEPALFHTHSNDNVSIELSGDKTKSQTMGGEWGAPGDVVPGRVGFHKATGRPYTHRVGSAGEKPYHVIDVEIFP